MSLQKTSLPALLILDGAVSDDDGAEGLVFEALLFFLPPQPAATRSNAHRRRTGRKSFVRRSIGRSFLNASRGMEMLTPGCRRLTEVRLAEVRLPDLLVLAQLV